MAADLRQPPHDLLIQVEAAEAEPGTVALWYTGGAGYVLKTPRATVYVDPFTTAEVDETWVRALAPPFDAAQVTACDLILSTHEHLDHCDPAVLRPMLAGTKAPFAGPATSIEVARELGWPEERLRALGWGDTLEVAGVKLTTVKSVDPMARGCNGYVIETEGLTIVHMGDSLWYDEIGQELRRWSVDAICLSVAHNPPDRTLYMSEVDAVRAARDAGAKVLIPHHFDLWQVALMDPRRIQAAAPWYAPDCQVRPARYCERMTLTRAGGGVVVR